MNMDIILRELTENELQKNNQYKFKYQYQKVWVDVTLVRTNNNLPSPLPQGIFESRIKVQPTNGAPLHLDLVGENNSQGVSNFLFTVINVAPTPFPFGTLNTKLSAINSLKVGEIKYYSNTKGANLELSSSPTGSAIAFKFISGALEIPYTIAFNRIIPALGFAEINTTNLKFPSQYTTTPSPLGDFTNKVYAIEGDVSIYLTVPLTPMAGTYTSTIYCILTQT